MKRTLLALTAIFSVAILLSLGFADAQEPTKLGECVPLDKNSLLTAKGSYSITNETDRQIITVNCVMQFVFPYKFPELPQKVLIPIINPETGEPEIVEVPLTGSSTIPNPKPTPPTNPIIKDKVEIPISETFDEDELPVILECARGKGEWKPIQQRDRFEVAADYIFSIRKYTGETRALALNMKWQECHWANEYRPNLGPAYATLKVVDDFPEQMEAMHRQKDPRTSGVIYPVVTPEQIKFEEEKAREALCNASWSVGVCTEKYTTVDKTTKGTINPHSDVGKKYNDFMSQYPVKDFRAGGPFYIKASMKAQDVACENAWNGVGKGKKSPAWWPQMLTDGTCAEWIVNWHERNGIPLGSQK